MNSREKGKRGEREFASLLREHGFDARRGQQFAGGEDSPDVISPALRWLHIEVKRTQALNLRQACAQAEGDCAGKPWIVAHRRNHAPWLITMRAELFFELVQDRSPVSHLEQENTGEAEGRSMNRQQDAGSTFEIRTDAWAKTEDGWRRTDGGWRMADGGGRMAEDGWRRAEDGGRMAEVRSGE